MRGAIMGNGTELDAGGARDAALTLELSAGMVESCADRLDERTFGPDAAGRNYRSDVAALSEALSRLPTGLRAWSAASASTASSIREAVTASSWVDAASGESVRRAAGNR